MSGVDGGPPETTYRYVKTSSRAAASPPAEAVSREDGARSREVYLDLVEEQCQLPDVEVGRMLRSEGLKVRGKVFAMLVGDRLVVKVPAELVDEAVAAGAGARFEPTEGRVMREWLAIPLLPGDAGPERWHALVDEARVFVASLPTSTRRRR